MDPYVRMQVGSRVFKTKTHTDGGKNPSWNDEFSFKRTNEDVVNIYVYDEDDVSSDDLVGEGRFMLSKVCSGITNTFNENLPLFYKGKGAGEIFLSVVFQPDYVGVAMQPVLQATYAIPATTAYVAPMRPTCKS